VWHAFLNGEAMNDFTTSTRSAMALTHPRPLPATKGVRGWLLALCLMLTVVGPIISLGLMVNVYTEFAPYLAGSPGLLVAICASLLIAACSIVFGVYAGLGLWLIRPKAVNTAKNALLFGFAADIITATIEIASAQGASQSGSLLRQIEVSLVPSLIFFVLCYAYLNRSERVHATYELQ
jgi:hypothetical protein